MRKPHYWKSGQKRWFLETGPITWSLEVGKVRGLVWATARYGGQERFAVISAGAHWGFWLGIATPFKWHRIRPRDGKYGESQAEFGLQWSSGRGRLWFGFGHDPWGTWYGGGNGPSWKRALRQTWKNRELSLWENDWLTGRKHTRWVDVAEFPFVLEVGQWQGDSYEGTMKLRRLVWTQRFWRSGQRLDWDFEMPSPGKGIPVPGHDDCDFSDGDDAIFGFGESADHFSLTEAAERLRDRVIQQRGDWRPRAVHERNPA